MEKLRGVHALVVISDHQLSKFIDWIAGAQAYDLTKEKLEHGLIVAYKAFIQGCHYQWGDDVWTWLDNMEELDDYDVVISDKGCEA